jgi:exodeoxyribonuclease V gamma subunit
MLRGSMAFYVHRSNRTERLVDALAGVVAQPQANVLASEWIVVSSPGMERWLSMQLAQRVGIWANPQFPFPRKLIDTLMQAALDHERPRHDGYEPTCMQFSIARLLQRDLGDDRFAEVRRYLGDDAAPGRRLQLAGRLSELFDQYLTYRPELVLSWQAGAEQDFQAPLLRALIEQHGPYHLAARAAQASVVLKSRARPLTGFPERIHLFGLSSMPPLYLELLSALGHSCDLHLFLLSPSQHYFGDQVPPKRVARTTRGRKSKISSQQLQLSFEDPSFEQRSHPLLSSLGRHAREFQALLEERLQYREGADDLYEDPGERNLLHAIQSDLLQLSLRGGDGGEPRYHLRPDDASISIHACHGPMRELEVLHDQLSQLITQGVAAPHEIIVMAPNISQYAKVIDAVFSQPPLQRPQIPFRIADRGVAETQPLFLCLSALLDLLQGRFGANQVLDLLGYDLIRDRFGIAVDQVDDLRDWIKASEIRWGVDASHRAREDQPACADNTWQLGLSRLVLGYSTRHAPDQLYAGISPASMEMESGQGELLGSFLELCHSLFELQRSFSRDATAAEWSERMLRLVESIFGEHADAAERRQLLVSLKTLAEQAALAGYDEAFDLTALRNLLSGSLAMRMPAQGFLSSGVTFCQLLPMRSIPFKVLCLVGLNDGVFPQSDIPLTFDVISHKRQLGDRSRRDDDRQLFLESILSARERLLITYVGQSQRTNKPLPPSVLVQELIDYVSQTCKLPGEPEGLTELQRVDAMHARLCLRHPLSSASPRYFGADTDPRLFSYAAGSCAAARASLQEPQQPAPFAVLQHALQELPTALSMRDLERCLMRPARAFCQRRLNLMLGDDLSALPEREPFQLDHLERWKIATEWLEHALQGRAEASRFEVQRARGRLPHFVSGELVYEELQADVLQIQAAFGEITRGAPARSVPVDLSLSGLRLSGTLTDVYPEVHARLQYSKLGSRHELRQFIRYVVLGCLADQDPSLRLPRRSVLVARTNEPRSQTADVVSFELSTQECVATLRELLALYVEASAAPLPLFSHASFSYADKVGDGEEAAMRAARTAYGDRGSVIGGQKDLPDPYVEQLFGDFDQMLCLAHTSFAAVAQRLYSPLLRARRAV